MTEITFMGDLEIHYARIPAPGPGSYLLPAAADATPAHKTFSQVESRPASGMPHWKKGTGAVQDAELSWPAVYVRTGARTQPARLKASFQPHPPNCNSATVKIKATSNQGVNIAEKTLTFAGGHAQEIFDLQDLPNTVKRLDGLEFTWTFEIHSSIRSVRKTKHTLFVTDQPPKTANLHPRRLNKFLWEIFEWSCKWADGMTGHSKVLDTIWGEFHPVKNAHDTGLVYWKNWDSGVGPNQDLVSAIWSQDKEEDVRNAASCIVFDEVLMNCLAAHGISSAEVMLETSMTTFTRDGHVFTCTGWRDKTTYGQGNPNAPPSWNNHWIADVNVIPDWKLFDPSYGEGPTSCSAPSAPLSEIDIQSYEPLTVDKFECQSSSGSLELLDRKPGPPHLKGTILWTNR